MSIYLQDIPLDEARSLLQRSLEKHGLNKILGKETIKLTERSVGRILAKPIFAKISSPHYHASAMDGFAVKAEKTIGAQPSSPINLSVGSITKERIDAVYVDTGDPLPEGFNSVIPIENTEAINKTGEISRDARKPEYIRIRSGVTPWSHIRPLGEDIVVTQLIFPAGHKIRPFDLGAIAAAGYKNILVARKPRVAVIPTGSELVEVGSPLKPGDIIEYNSLILASMINEWGGRATRFPIVPDIYQQISSCVLDAAKDSDLILLNAGSSAGSEDFSAEIVGKNGELLIHGVAVRPGHPVIIGFINLPGDNRKKPLSNELPRKNVKKWVPIIGIPGYPVSAVMISELFVEPLIARWTGRFPMERSIEKAKINRKLTSPPGTDDFVRVSLGKVGNKFQAIPLSRGAGVISSLVFADGLLHLNSGIQGLQSGEEVVVELLRQKEVIARTILCIGSHDISLDILSQFITERNNRFVSINVGSQGGLIAIEKGEAHLAGVHLLEPETGKYNIASIKKYIQNTKVNLFGFVEREQGLIVRRGNPKGIRGLIDLGREDISYINRQRGAGTRVLLDYLLGKIGLSGGQIRGYEDEEFTHLSVAAAISSGRADCGLGIPAAAQALDLTFIPITEEKYQLIIPTAFLDLDIMKNLFDVLSLQKFRQAVEKLPGYKTIEMGKLMAEFG